MADSWKLEKSLSFQDAPFLFIKQFVSAKKLLIMPHSSFHKLAEEAGDPTADGRHLTMINMTARCGSTLLCQMANTVPGVRTVSEPWALAHLRVHYVTGKIESEETVEKLLDSSVRLLCKREPGSDVEHVIIKGMQFTSYVPAMLKRRYPRTKVVFNTRTFGGTAKSFMQIVQGIPPIARYGEYLTGKVFEQTCAFHLLHYLRGWLFLQMFHGFGGVFPQDDPKWWRNYMRFCSKYRTLLDMVMFDFCGQVSVNKRIDNFVNTASAQRFKSTSTTATSTISSSTSKISRPTRRPSAKSCSSSWEFRRSACRQR